MLKNGNIIHIDFNSIKSLTKLNIKQTNEKKTMQIREKKTITDYVQSMCDAHAFVNLFQGLVGMFRNYSVATHNNSEL